MIERIISWWRTGHIRRLEKIARSLAVEYQTAKTRYESALIEEGKRGKTE